MPASVGRRAGKPAPRARAAAPPPSRKPVPPAGPTFTMVRTKRIFEEIADQVRQMMADGSLQPGDKLPAERDLAVRFGVSRPALREALRGLEAAGVLRLHKGVKGGAYVLKGDPEMLSRSLRDVYHLGGLTLDDITEARTILMQAVVELAITRIDPAALASLRENLARLAALPAHVIAADRIASGAEFYHLLAGATGNAALTAIVDAVTSVVLQQVARAGPRPIPHLLAHRRRLLADIENGRAADARNEITRHLRRLHAHLLKETRAP